MFSIDLHQMIEGHGSDSDTENYRSVWHQTHSDVTDKNNNVSFECLDKHYQ